MSIKDALKAARLKAVALNPTKVTFTRNAQTLNDETGGMEITTSTFDLNCRVVSPGHSLGLPGDVVVRTGGAAIDADWLLLFESETADIMVGDAFLHPLHLSACQITGIEQRGAGGVVALIVAMAKEVNP